MPLPVLAETVSTGTPFSCDRPFLERRLDAVEQRRSVVGDVPFVDRDDQHPALLDRGVGDLQILHLEAAGGVEQQQDDLAAVDRAAGVGDRQPLELVVDLGLLAQAGGVDQPHLLAPPPGSPVHRR